jgi:hypothetical protein
VPYVNVAGYDGTPAKAFATPEGYGLEYDEDGHVIAITLVNVRWLLERDWELTITWPAAHVTPDELAEALRPAS